MLKSTSLPRVFVLVVRRVDIGACWPEVQGETREHFAVLVIRTYGIYVLGSDDDGDGEAGVNFYDNVELVVVF